MNRSAPTGPARPGRPALRCVLPRFLPRFLPGFVFAGLALAAASPALAATKGGVTMPDTLPVDGSTLVLNGIGLRTFTFLHIRGYVGALYLPRKSSDVETVLSEPGPKVLTIQYVHNGTVAQLNKLYMDSSRTYCAHHTCTEADKTDFETLLGAIQPVKPGDVSSFVMTDHGVQVLFNGKQVALVPDAAFGKVILDSDLGSTAPSAELRDGLLGLSDS